MKKTKIICSIGPSSNSKEVFTAMVRAGMNVARCNFSHATIEERQTVHDLVFETNKLLGTHVALLYDTKGPEFRSGVAQEGGIKLVRGATIRVVKENVVGNEERFSVNHPEALDSLEPGNVIQLENGLMKIEVVNKEEDGVTCKVINGGTLLNKKSLFVPGIVLNIPFISETDKEDIIYACEHDGDFLALSFVSTKEDVLAAKEIIDSVGGKIKIIAKIESQAGVENLDEILDLVDGIMVARGDLGEEVPMSMLAVYQKKMIKKAREHGKICIVATEMLESMKHNSRPTRAEITDVANAVLDGTDAIMLSGETTVGEYPIETVSYMASIAEDTENHCDHNFEYKGKIGRTECIAKGAVDLTDYVDIKAIAVASISGFTAKFISNFRPSCPIMATVTDETVARGLALNYGIYTSIIPVLHDMDEIVMAATAKTKEFFNLEPENKIIVTGGTLLKGKARITNFMKIEEID